MKKWTAAALAALTALTLTGCSFQDVMLYLYGGDSFVTSAEPDYTTCDGDNGVTVVYDQNQWEQPVMAQDDTLSLTTGNQLSYTVVLLQTTDTYTDFLAQSGQEALPYPMPLCRQCAMTAAATRRSLPRSTTIAARRSMSRPLPARRIMSRSSHFCRTSGPPAMPRKTPRPPIKRPRP